MIQAFVPVSYHCSVSCSTAAKRLLAFQRLQGSMWPCTVVNSKLSYIVSFNFYQATNWTKTDMWFCQVDLRVEVDG